MSNAITIGGAPFGTGTVPVANGGTGTTNAQASFLVPIPAALSAKYALEGATLSLIENGSLPYAQCSLTPEQIFGNYSTALSAPGVTYYVAVSGSDAANGLTPGTAFATMGQAVTAANAGGVSAKVIVSGPNIYPRSSSPSFPLSQLLSPTVDMAWIANNGRIAMGAFDLFSAPSKDGTQTNTYSFARSNCDRVYDLLNVDQFGCYNQLRLVASAALCNLTPGSWYTDNTTVYVNRADGAAVTNTNTRYVLNTANVFLNANNRNIYIGDGAAGATGYGFDVEGGYIGGFYSNVSGASVTKRATVVVGTTFRYAGGRLGTTGRGVALDGQKGPAWFFSCDASCNATDGFNQHDNIGTLDAGMITVNCTGNNNGQSPNTSCNGWTHHETCYGYDFAGRYEGNNGGTMRSINNTVGLLAGTYVKNDMGDVRFGGTIRPTAFRVDDSAVYYCYRTKADMVGGGVDYQAMAGATLNKRDVWPSRGSTGGAGTIGTW